MLPPYIVEWVEFVTPSETRPHEIEVRTVEELDVALDRVAAESDPEVPFAATLIPGDATLGISEGIGWSSLSFAFANGDPPFHVSVGDRDAEGVVLTIFGGQETELARWSCVEPALAREAMRFFFHTGGLSPRVSWAPNALWNTLWPGRRGTHHAEDQRDGVRD